MTDSRIYTTRRAAIVNAIITLIKENLNGYTYSSRVGEIYNRIKFFDDLNDFPVIFVVAGNETRIYQGGGYKDRYLDIRLMIFVKEENPLDACEKILEDLETLLEQNAQLNYTSNKGTISRTKDITVSSLTTDEGALDPISLGEINLQIYY